MIQRQRAQQADTGMSDMDQMDAREYRRTLAEVKEQMREKFRDDAYVNKFIDILIRSGWDSLDIESAVRQHENNNRQIFLAPYLQEGDAKVVAPGPRNSQLGPLNGHIKTEGSVCHRRAHHTSHEIHYCKQIKNRIHCPTGQTLPPCCVQ